MKVTTFDLFFNQRAISGSIDKVEGYPRETVDRTRRGPFKLY